MKLSIHQIAKSLDLPVSTVDRWIRQGRIPVQKSGPEVTFEATVLEKWAAGHHLPFCLPGDEALKEPEEDRPGTLVEAMETGGVFYRVAGNDMPSVLASAVDVMPGLPQDERQALYKTLLEREKLTSTGIGKGVAIPHPRAPLAQLDGPPQITTCFLEQPVAYNAIDDQPVFVLFLLLSTSIKVHLHLLSRLAFCVRDGQFIDFLKTMPAAEQLMENIAAFEKDLDRSESTRAMS